MRKISILLLAILWFFQNKNCCALTFNGDLTLSNQTQVDAFNYDRVTGTLTIDGNTITNLNNLNTLDTVGSLIIQNTNITSLNGLSNLKYINGSASPMKLHIINNANLTGLSQLSNAYSNKSNSIEITISNNNALTSISGIKNLFISNNSASPILTIDNNPSLTTLNSFEVSYPFTYAFAFIIKNNPNLKSMDSIFKATHNQMEIINNDRLQYFNVNKALVFRSGKLVIQDNDSIQEIQILGNGSTSYYNEITISKNHRLIKANIAENTFPCAFGDTKIFIDNNTQLDSLIGFSDASAPPVYSMYFLKIHNNPSLKGVSMFNYPFTAGNGITFSDSVSIINNDALGNVDFMSDVKSISRNLHVLNNTSLTNCCGLYTLLITNNILGTISISSNPSECSNQTEIINSCPGGPTSTKQDNPLSISAYPNPADHTVLLRLEHALPGKVNIILVDLLGREYPVLNNQTGTEFLVKRNGLADGNYIIIFKDTANDQPVAFGKITFQ